MARRELIGWWIALLCLWLLLELRLHAGTPALALLAVLVAGALWVAAATRRTTST